MAAKRRPVVVGIDVGTECTKVAISIPVDERYYKEDEILWGSEHTDYALPTVVAYIDGKILPDFRPSLSKDSDAPGVEWFRWFKLQALNPSSGSKMIVSNTRNSSKPAKQLLLDFLTTLEQKIRVALNGRKDWEGLEWETTDIDFVFSIPSVVGPDGAKVLSEGARAVFDSFQSKHQVIEISMTEAEVAGAFAVKTMGGGLKKGDTALVLDLGGGTSDMSMMAIASSENWKLDTNFLKPVSSAFFGGAYIDQAVRDMVESYLDHLQTHGNLWMKATEMADEVLQDLQYHVKKNAQELLEVNFRHLGQDIAVPDGLENGRISMSGNKLKIDGSVFAALFDEQLFGNENKGGIIFQAVQMRDDLYCRKPSQSRQFRKDYGLDKATPTVDPDTLDLVIFTGGMGASKRVQLKVEEALRAPLQHDAIQLSHTTAKTRFLNTGSNVGDFQLCVCKGLVFCRVQEILRGEKDRPVSYPWLPYLRTRK